MDGGAGGGQGGKGTASGGHKVCDGCLTYWRYMSVYTLQVLPFVCDEPAEVALDFVFDQVLLPPPSLPPSLPPSAS